jgi:hypothetical protein
MKSALNACAKFILGNMRGVLSSGRSPGESCESSPDNPETKQTPNQEKGEDAPIIIRTKGATEFVVISVLALSTITVDERGTGNGRIGAADEPI